MTADIINLRSVRKQKLRAQAADKANQNRAKFGRSKAERQTSSNTKLRADQHLDRHKLDDKTRDDD